MFAKKYVPIFLAFIAIFLLFVSKEHMTKKLDEKPKPKTPTMEKDEGEFEDKETPA